MPKAYMTAIEANLHPPKKNSKKQTKQNNQKKPNQNLPKKQRDVCAREAEARVWEQNGD